MKLSLSSLSIQMSSVVPAPTSHTDSSASVDTVREFPHSQTSSWLSVHNSNIWSDSSELICTSLAISQEIKSEVIHFSSLHYAGCYGVKPSKTEHGDIRDLSTWNTTVSRTDHNALMLASLNVCKTSEKTHSEAQEQMVFSVTQTTTHWIQIRVEVTPIPD